MGWSSLPDDMVDLILGSLSLVELGRVSTTCRSFHTFFCKWMAAQQKARCDLAVEWFGRERVTCLADIVNGVLKWESLDETLTMDRLHIRHTAILGRLWFENPLRHMARQSCEAGHIEMRYAMYPTLAYVRVLTPNQTWVRLRVDAIEKKVVITLAGSAGLVGLEGVSLVQALLSWGFGPQHDAWPHADVSIFREGSTFTRAELDAQIAPLLPLVAQHTNWRGYRW